MCPKWEILERMNSIEKKKKAHKQQEERKMKSFIILVLTVPMFFLIGCTGTERTDTTGNEPGINPEFKVVVSE